ncbi:MAG: hypothetical protein D6772_14960 [Bacteroidetes bacterium]|nr:MAG: hypothetical protein D6772_14960 [Bacteroidota bacterium]
MRSKLHKFTRFTETLLPHETAYLLAVQQLKDEDRLNILRQVDNNARQIGAYTAYDTNIDKRKYNHLQNWIKERLSQIDVDEQFKWMIDLEQQIATDSISTEGEKQLLLAIQKQAQPVFFFRKFYQLVEQYRHFLLIRLRYHDYDLIQDFLEQHRSAYLRSQAVHEKLHQATLNIVEQYAKGTSESQSWETWLAEVFYDETLDGHTRYLALVRLTFLCYNYRNYDLLRDKMDYLDQQFRQGKYYSKRLLLNYYNNRLMLHAHYEEYEQALYYGYLSVRTQNHDYPLYINNLCAILLRLGKNQEALELMKGAAPLVKRTTNIHNRVSFVAFYMEALNENGLYRNAVSYGDVFLRAYAKEVLQYRWHLFFTVYLEALVYLQRYERVLKVAQKYKLQEREQAYARKHNYQPKIPLLISLARYHEGLETDKTFRQQVDTFITQSGHSERFRAYVRRFAHHIQSSY